MLATVVALYNAGRDFPLSRPRGRRTEGMLSNGVSVLVAAAMPLVTMPLRLPRQFSPSREALPPHSTRENEKRERLRER